MTVETAIETEAGLAQKPFLVPSICQLSAVSSHVSAMIKMKLRGNDAAVHVSSPLMVNCGIMGNKTEQVPSGHRLVWVEDKLAALVGGWPLGRVTAISQEIFEQHYVEA